MIHLNRSQIYLLWQDDMCLYFKLIQRKQSTSLISSLKLFENASVCNFPSTSNSIEINYKIG